MSVNGVQRVQKGGSSCSSSESDGAANVAIARGESSFAEAGRLATDAGNRARASGGARAVAIQGDNNTATADGDGALAVACCGDNNTATATGACLAVANGGDETTECVGP